MQGEHPALYTVGVGDRKLSQLAEDQSGDGTPIAPSWSADGKWLVFARLPCDGCASEIRKLPGNRPRSGGLGRVIANGLVPNVSATGNVVFIGFDGGLYTVRLDGSHLRRLLTPAQTSPGIDAPHVSPDGRQVAFVRHDLRGRGWIETMQIDGRGSRRLTQAGAFANPSWSPDGKRIAFARQGPDGLWRICIARRDGSGIRVISPAGHSDSYPTWSPDGKRLAFVRQTRSAHAIYTIDVDGTHARRLTPPSLDAIEPDWSPLGNEIAFAVTGDED
jgi:TolB protein